MAILDYPADIWREALDLPPGKEPQALILEGTWWRKSATENRLAKLDDVRELSFPGNVSGPLRRRDGCLLLRLWRGAGG